MDDSVQKPDREDIKRDLARSVIKEPLLAELKSAAPEQRIPVILEINDEYYRGKTDAAQRLNDLLADAAKSTNQPASSAVRIGGEQNPYYKARLVPAVIKALVETDNSWAEGRREVAKLEEAQRAREEQTTRAPEQLVRYLLIRRIWRDHALRPLIDQSVRTVKVDAARRSFMADGRDIVWAVIDSGIDQTHVHFQQYRNLDVTLPVKHRDFTCAPGSPEEPLVDKLGHGTHVAGIVAGSYTAAPGAALVQAERCRLGSSEQIETFTEPVTDIAGMAPACKLVSMKVLNANGDGEVSNLIAAIDAIQVINDYGRNLKIHGVNLSVGYEFDPAWFACGQTPICVEVDRLARTGVVVVVAAGNTGYGVLAANVRPTGAGMMLTINDPGNAELPITVGATHRDGPHTYGVSYFSSKGPTGDGRMKPDLVAPGERILSCCSSGKQTGGDKTYVEDSGTSMAAPHVSGVIAAFLSIRREYIGRHDAVKRLFLSTATDLDRNPYFQGRGLIDLMRAIQSV